MSIFTYAAHGPQLSAVTGCGDRRGGGGGGGHAEAFLILICPSN